MADLEHDGYTILEGVVEPGLVALLVGALAELSRGVAPADNDFEGTHTVRLYNLLARGEIFSRVPVHPQVLPVVEKVLDPGCLISSLSSIAIGPDESPQPIHADDQIIPLPKPHPPTVCNTCLLYTSPSPRDS